LYASPVKEALCYLRSPSLADQGLLALAHERFSTTQ
jgi:hypothetical protein